MRNICKVPKCSRHCKGQGLCSRHYSQWLIHGKILDHTRYDSNEIIIKGNIAEIVLYNSKCKEKARAIIDAEDVERIKNYKWYLNNQGYVTTTIKSKKIRIQHLINNLESNRKVQIDHKDRDKLNNCKSNFRVCTHMENNWNSIKNKNNTTGFKGVFAAGEKWRSQIMANRKLYYLGTFKTKVEAVKAYNKAAIKHHGEFACLNNI